MQGGHDPFPQLADHVEKELERWRSDIVADMRLVIGFDYQVSLTRLLFSVGQQPDYKSGFPLSLHFGVRENDWAQPATSTDDRCPFEIITKWQRCGPLLSADFAGDYLIPCEPFNELQLAVANCLILWLRRCWIEADGTTFSVPTFASGEDSSRAFELRSGVWCPSVVYGSAAELDVWKGEFDDAISTGRMALPSPHAFAGLDEYFTPAFERHAAETSRHVAELVAGLAAVRPSPDLVFVVDRDSFRAGEIRIVLRTRSFVTKGSARRRKIEFVDGVVVSPSVTKAPIPLDWGVLQEFCSDDDVTDELFSQVANRSLAWLYQMWRDAVRDRYPASVVGTRTFGDLALDFRTGRWKLRIPPADR
jgi:hypothetical protein